jgi:hypothetical protein
MWAVVGAGPESGVVDAANRAYGYENLLVTDGASIPAKEGEEPRHLPEAARPARASVAS